MHPHVEFWHAALQQRSQSRSPALLETMAILARAKFVMLNGPQFEPTSATIPPMALLMDALDKLIRYVAGFFGVVFLFGQAFAGEFSLGGTFAAVGGIVAAALAYRTSPAVLRSLLLAGCAVGVLGAVLHAWEYYSVPHVPGNYYAWFITAPFALSLVYIAYRAAVQQPD